MSFNAEGLVETGRRNLTDDFRRQIYQLEINSGLIPSSIFFIPQAAKLSSESQVAAK